MSKPQIKRAGTDAFLYGTLFILIGLTLAVTSNIYIAIVVTPALYFLWRLGRRVKVLEQKIAELETPDLGASKAEEATKLEASKTEDPDKEKAQNSSGQEQTSNS